MKKYFLAPIFLALLLFFGTVTVPFAKAAKSEMPEVEALAATPQPVNSFEFFWPLVAGKTMADKTYFIKILKEEIREFFIFGKAQKADHQVFRATKRVLEAEKLFGMGKGDLAIKTLDKATILLAKAKENWARAKEGGSGLDTTKANLGKELNNLSIFLPSLASRYADAKTQIDGLNKLVKDFASSL